MLNPTPIIDTYPMCLGFVCHPFYGSLKKNGGYDTTDGYYYNREITPEWGILWELMLEMNSIDARDNFAARPDWWERHYGK